MNKYALQNKKTRSFIYTETKLSHTVELDKALLFTEDVIKDKLKQYSGYKAIPYVGLGKVVSKY